MHMILTAKATIVPTASHGFAPCGSTLTRFNPVRELRLHISRRRTEALSGNWRFMLHRVLVGHKKIDFVKGKERLGQGSGHTGKATDIL